MTCFVTFFDKTLFNVKECQKKTQNSSILTVQAKTSNQPDLRSAKSLQASHGRTNYSLWSSSPC